MIMKATRKTLMVVDDDLTNLRIAKNALSDFYDVFTVLSAAKMFDLLERKKPALILLDIEMPEMNGREAIKILQERPQTRDIPVIFLTGANNPDSEPQEFSLGAADYISKPFDPILLRERIKFHLSRRK
jgi:CheY-like chemotaxis protein